MIEIVKESLTGLRLRAMADNLDFRNQQALNANMSYLEFLKCLIEDERAKRDKNAFHLRLKVSGLNPSKSLESYNFSLQPNIDVKQIVSLANCDFIPAKGNWS